MSGVAYLFVASFESGYNLYFGIPGDFFQMNLLSVFHAFALYPISWEALLRSAPHWQSLSTLIVVAVVLVILLRINVSFFWRYPLPFSTFVAADFVFSFIFTPAFSTLFAVALFIIALAACTWIPSLRRRPWYVTLHLFFGQPEWQFKVIAVAIYLMAPSYFLGYVHASYGRTVFETESLNELPAMAPKKYIAVRFTGDAIVLKPYCDVNVGDAYCKHFSRELLGRRDSFKNRAMIVIDGLRVSKSDDPSLAVIYERRLDSRPDLYDQYAVNLNRFSTWLCIRGNEWPCHTDK